MKSFALIAALVVLGASGAWAQTGAMDQAYADQLYAAMQAPTEAAYQQAKGWCDQKWSQDSTRPWAGPNDLKFCYITQGYIADYGAGRCAGHGFPVGANPRYRRNDSDAAVLNKNLQYTAKAFQAN
jgi:hypothetical protein